jgi:hypothetical protein
LSPLGRRPYYLAALLVSLLALGLIALVAPRTGSAQSTAGVIVYGGVDHNLWRINADGRSRLQLTQDGMSDNPTWVPGGSQIVFASTRDQKVVTPPEGRLVLNQIYLMGSDGSNPVRLSDGSSDDKLPDVSADGQRIIFLRNHNWRTAGGNPVRDTEIGSMRLDGSDYQALGSQVTELRTRIDRYPARISRDGSKVVVVRQEQGLSNRVQVLDVATHQFTTLNLAPDQGAAEGSVAYLWPRFDQADRIVVLRRAYNSGVVQAQLISFDANGGNVQTLASGLSYEALANGFDVNWAEHTLVGGRAPELPGGLRPEEIYLYDLATGRASSPLDSGHAPSFSPVRNAPPEPGPTATAAPPTASPTPGPPPAGQLIDTPDPLFYRVWERVDRAVRENAAVRSWIWGPVGRAVEHEPYGGGTRLVQYFDKARMELNPASGDKPAYVTNGLLVVEMLSGRIQVGPAQYEARIPAAVAVGGDGASNPAPSYAALARVASLAGENQAAAALGSPVTATLNADGIRGTGTFPSPPRIAYFAPQTGHNIPDVFYNFLTARGKVYSDGGYRTDVVLDWVFTVGYPVTEPYWTRMSIAGQVRDVMVQAFQRQVLTYIPDYQAPWNVQFGNVGLQYYQWRYGKTP